MLLLDETGHVMLEEEVEELRKNDRGRFNYLHLTNRVFHASLIVGIFLRDELKVPDWQRQCRIVEGLILDALLAKEEIQNNFALTFARGPENNN